MIVIASIHQPSTNTFNLFDKLLLLSSGKPHYFGPVDKVVDYYAELGYAIPNHTNPAEFLLELVNTDFTANPAHAHNLVETMAKAWQSSVPCQKVHEQVAAVGPSRGQELSAEFAPSGENPERRKPSSPSLVATLLHRSFVKSYRDVVAYGIRIAMYTGLAIMMGTVWLRLSTDQSSIIPFTNAIVSINQSSKESNNYYLMSSGGTTG